jgi:hypothetical protein
MPKNSTPAAASQSLVSFSFNLPANFAALFAKVVKADGLTPQQAAAVAVTSWLRSGCDAHRLPGFDDRKAQALAVAANAAGADPEHVNVTLLADDLDYLVAGEEDRLRNDTGAPEELVGTALVDHIARITPCDDAYQQALVVRTRRLLAAKEVGQ